MSRPGGMKLSIDRETAGMVAMAAGSAICIYYVCRYLFAREPQRAPIALSCHCGAVQGEIHPSSPLRVVCYCDDCQNYSSWVLARNPSTAAAVHPVDAFGGTDIVQVFKSEVVITAGAEHLRMVKIKADTRTLRVFADCCSSPLFNTRKGSSTVGLITSALASSEGLPPVRYRIMGQFAKGSPPGVSDGVPLRFMVTYLVNVLLNRGKKNPCPVDLDGDYLVAD